MLTPIVSFATNDTAGDTQAEETNADDTAASDNKTTANTAAAPVEKNGVVNLVQIFVIINFAVDCITRSIQPLSQWVENYHRKKWIRH